MTPPHCPCGCSLPGTWTRALCGCPEFRTGEATVNRTHQRPANDLPVDQREPPRGSRALPTSGTSPDFSASYPCYVLRPSSIRLPICILHSGVVTCS